MLVDDGLGNAGTKKRGDANDGVVDVEVVGVGAIEPECLQERVHSVVGWVGKKRYVGGGAGVRCSRLIRVRWGCYSRRWRRAVWLEGADGRAQAQYDGGGDQRCSAGWVKRPHVFCLGGGGCCAAWEQHLNAEAMFFNRHRTSIIKWRWRSPKTL